MPATLKCRGLIAEPGQKQKGYVAATGPLSLFVMVVSGAHVRPILCQERNLFVVSLPLTKSAAPGQECVH